MKPKIACCLITLDRADITKNVMQHNSSTAGLDFDLLVYDNGSFEEELEKLQPVFTQAIFVHKAGKNMGVGYAFNQLIHYAVQHKYDLIVLIGNDIENHPGWLAKMWDYSQAIPNSGLIALNWGCGANPIERRTVNGLEIDACEGVFGVTAIPNKVIDTIGYFCEDYYPYGLEDATIASVLTKAALPTIISPAYKVHTFATT